MQKQPSNIGPYTIHSELGRGGMSVVYRATDTRLGMVVALKLLPPVSTPTASSASSTAGPGDASTVVYQGYSFEMTHPAANELLKGRVVFE